MSLFESLVEHESYCSDFRQQKVITGRNVDISPLEGSRIETLFFEMGWLLLVSLHEPMYATLVQVFFARARISGSRIMSMLQELEFDISASKLCHLLFVPSTGIRVFKSKTWPQIDGFDPVIVVRRFTGSTTYRVSRLQANYLTNEARLLHQIVRRCILPRSGHWNKVFYVDAFILDSILVGRPIDLGHPMIQHMISSHNVSGWVLPYKRLFTRLFTFHGFNLSDQTNR